ncbi:MAG: hypothetical protein DME65_12565 [Verrucomicrobia bacterium]|nr:MAG: hypothetical protein DME65_12565 [Verrucomicrobiota bacterium]
MKKIIFSLLPAIFLWLGSCCITTAQQSQVAQSDQITTDGQRVIQDDNSPTGRFEPVTVNQWSTSNVGLQFSASLANQVVLVEALDGGTLGIEGESATIHANGTLSFPFQVTDQSGVYRVVVINPAGGDDGTAVVAALVQLEVPAPVD